MSFWNVCINWITFLESSQVYGKDCILYMIKYNKLLRLDILMAHRQIKLETNILMLFLLKYLNIVIDYIIYLYSYLMTDPLNLLNNLKIKKTHNNKTIHRIRIWMISEWGVVVTVQLIDCFVISMHMHIGVYGLDYYIVSSISNQTKKFKLKSLNFWYVRCFCAPHVCKHRAIVT